MSTARAIIKVTNKGVLKTADRNGSRRVPDLSDVQELRAKLIRAHHRLDPQVRVNLDRLDR